MRFHCGNVLVDMRSCPPQEGTLRLINALVTASESVL